MGSQGQNPVIHNQRRGQGYVQAKARWNFNKMAAFFCGFWRQAAFFRAQNIGCIQRVFKTRQVNRSFVQLHANKHAPLWHDEIIQTIPFIERQMLITFRRVSTVNHGGAMMGIYCKCKAGPKSMASAQQCSEIHRFGDSFHANSEITAH